MMVTTAQMTPISTSYPDSPYGSHLPLSSPAFESAVTSFASRVLRSNSPQEANFDSNVASYVISILRNAFPESSSNSDSLANDHDLGNAVQSLDEYQSMMELLEEHCNMSTETAHGSLQTIANAVRTGVFDDGNSTFGRQNSLGSSMGSNSHLGGMMNFGGSHVGSRLGRYRSKSMGAEADLGYDDGNVMNLLNGMLRQTGVGDNPSLFASLNSTPEDERENFEEETSFLFEEDELPKTPYQKDCRPDNLTPLTSEETSMTDDWTPMDKSVPNSNKMTPLKPDRLIPVDLLGVIDDPSTPGQNKGKVASGEKYDDNTVENSNVKTEKKIEKITAENFVNNTLLPPVASSAPTGRGKKKKKGKSKDLAAALFGSTRSRSNSLQVEKSPKLQPMVASPNNVPSFGLSSSDQNNSSTNNSPMYQKQVDSSVQILLALNYEICEEAAYEAALVSNADVNIAQYVIDGAMSAPPVCRHMLNDGCYRSDCQFSHDVEGHTCSFWLRGRCGKGDGSCRFMHGFSTKLLNGLKIDNSTKDQCRPVPTSSSSSSAPIPIKTSNLVEHNDASNARSFSNLANQNLSSSIPIKTSNLLQHNMNTSFSFGSNGMGENMKKRTVKIPQDLWNADFNRSPAAFHVEDPLERYEEVSKSVQRDDVIDLHFQSTKSFSSVLSSVLPDKLAKHTEVWVITGTGHHVNQNSHQKSGENLENSVVTWLISNGYDSMKGKDKNGFGGAVLVKR